MASHYYTNYPEKKVTAGKPPILHGAGSSPPITIKAGPFPGALGKAQPRNRSMGVKKIKIYNRSDGL